MKTSTSIGELRDQKEPKMDCDTERALTSFMQRLAESYFVREAILFGSRARRTHRPGCGRISLS
jgi:hypothetical protein